VRAALLAGVFATLVLPSIALAHVTVLPTFLENGKQSTLVFSAPNERAPHAVTRVTVTVPPGIKLVTTAPPPGWMLELVAGKAIWSGGRTNPGTIGQFPLRATSERAPAGVELVAVQRYDDGAGVTWTIPLTILPGVDAPKEHLWPAFLAGAVGLVAIVGSLVFFRLRRESTGRHAD
jgi:uncharacterized protein YcnI